MAAVEHATRTPEEIENLKQQWLKDPDWDLDTTSGFEAHRDELAEFQTRERERMAREWKAGEPARQRRLALINGYTAAFPVGDDQQGLTKREYIAIQLLEGFSISFDPDDRRDTFHRAVQWADEFLLALAEVNPGG